MQISTQEFLLLAKRTLLYIVETIEKQDAECLLDLDFDGDIITINSNDGVFVINKHSAAKEIWLSSPLSGPYHFAPHKNSKWHSNNEEDLYDILSAELNIKFSYEH